MALPEQEQGNFKTNYVFATVEQIDGKVYSNQTGAFPRAEEYQKAYNDFYAELTTKGYKPTLHKLDNELSRDVIEWIEKQQQAKVELMPPDMHLQNLSKQSIQIWKDHFIAGLAGLPDNFPISYWCSLVPQANIMLNLL
eukprot:13200173-Ditylum_brightwellii.AAC.2